MSYRLIKSAGLCLASMLMMSMALAGTANATPLWLLCLEGTNANNTKYEDNQCNKAKSSGKWESVAIGTKSDTVRIVALSLRLEDAKGELGAAIIMKCPEVKGGSGLIESNKLIVREAKVPKPSEECTAEGTGLFKACKTSSLENVEGANLPWEGVVSESGSEFVGKIKKGPGAAGEPGWKVRCAGVEDNCVTAAGAEEETSGTAGVVTAGVLLILAKFKDAHGANCSVGGAGQGHVKGFAAILLASGKGLSLNK
jgi:hypothetical protein